MSLSPALFDPIVVTEVKSYLIEQPSARLTGNPWYMLVSVTLVLGFLCLATLLVGGLEAVRAVGILAAGLVLLSGALLMAQWTARRWGMHGSISGRDESLHVHHGMKAIRIPMSILKRIEISEPTASVREVILETQARRWHLQTTAAAADIESMLEYAGGFGVELEIRT